MYVCYFSESDLWSQDCSLERSFYHFSTFIILHPKILLLHLLLTLFLILLLFLVTWELIFFAWTYKFGPKRFVSCVVISPIVFLGYYQDLLQKIKNHSFLEKHYLVGYLSICYSASTLYIIVTRNFYVPCLVHK